MTTGFAQLFLDVYHVWVNWNGLNKGWSSKSNQSLHVSLLALLCIPVLCLPLILFQPLVLLIFSLLLLVSLLPYERMCVRAYVWAAAIIVGAFTCRGKGCAVSGRFSCAIWQHHLHILYLHCLVRIKTKNILEGFTSFYFEVQTKPEYLFTSVSII